MAVTLNDASRKIIEDKNFAALATLNADGSPQSSVVWVTLDGNDLLFSTVAGRLKERNLRRDPRVSVTIFDINEPYNYLEVRGNATITEEGGRELINALSRKYTGHDYTADGPDDQRVVIRLTPEKITGHAA